MTLRPKNQNPQVDNLPFPSPHLVCYNTPMSTPNPTCPKILTQYDFLVSLSEEFSRELLRAETGAKSPEEAKEALERALTLKQKIIEKKKELEEQLRVSPEQLQEILGSENVERKEQIEAVFGIPLETLPPVRLKRAEIEHLRDQARERGTVLLAILETPTMKHPETGEEIPKTLANMKRFFPKAHDGRPLLYTQDWYEKDEGSTFYNIETPPFAWKFVERDVLPESTNKNYAEQTELLAEYIRTTLFPENKIPPEYQQALDEWEEKKQAIFDLLAKETPADDKQAFTLLSALKITDLCRESNAEVLSDLILRNKTRNTKDLPDKWVFTKTVTKTAKFVISGYFDSDGATVYWHGPRNSNGSFGFRLFRMG